MSKHKDSQLNLRGGRYPLAELTTIKISKPVADFTTQDHLMVGLMLEELKRVKRNSNA